jgi:putative ABC transport system permease protein
VNRITRSRAGRLVKASPSPSPEVSPSPVAPPPSSSATAVQAITQSSVQAEREMRQSALQDLLQQLRVHKKSPFSSAAASLTSAFEAIWANRTRSILTMLGIFIGVAAVIAALTLTQSAGAYFTNLIAGLGANTIFVQPGTLSGRGVNTKQTTQSLTVADVQALRKVSHITILSPSVSAGVQAVYGNQNWKTRVQGVTGEYQTILDWEMAQGLWFSTSDSDGARSVAVIGDTVAHNLFDPSHTNPIGQTIRLNNQLYRVIGVAAPKGGFNQDDIIFIPFKTAQARFGFTNSVNAIVLQADSSDGVNLAVPGITAALERMHHLPKGTPDDFTITTSQQILQQAQQGTQVFSILLVSIAAISLTVGGIGIMNIMLVSVTQRTREIGIRMSIGARKSDIRNQFLIESLMLCLVGGSLGLLGGLLGGYGMTVGFGFPMVVNATTVIMPFIVSSLIAIIFGLYPASRAARLDPVIALRRNK